MKIDLHTHSTFSDGTLSAAELVQKAEEMGIEILSITDHDSIKSAKTIKCQNKVQCIPGVELSCQDEYGKYHILGYGYGEKAENLGKLTEYTHQLRLIKARQRVDALKSKFGIELSKEELQFLLSLPNPGKPHIANLLLKHGFAKTREEAFAKFLNHLYIPLDYITPQMAVDAITADGGIAVLAHPIFGDGRQYIAGNELEERIKRLKNIGICGIEVYYSGFDEGEISALKQIAKQNSLLITAGSDYHGTNKSISLGKTNLDDENFNELRPFLKAVGLK